MVSQTQKNRVWLKVVFIALFAVTLTSLRIIWIQAFDDPIEQDISKGALDLREWDFSESGPITLTGEWEFYPYELLEDAPTNEEGKHIDVPGDWSEALNGDAGHPYGYGSYYLKIQVDPDIVTSYSMRIASVRSASALYANGLPVGSSGEVGKSEADSFAYNVPYSSTSIRPNEDGEIHLVLQVANYADPRASGFVRAVKFGYEADVNKTTELSSILQIVTGVIFIVHALFALLAYLVGVRDKRLIYFSIVVLTLTYINVTGGDEKILAQYLVLDYTFTYKFSMFTMFLLSWSLVHTAGPQISMLSKRFLPIYTSLFIIAIIFIIILPMEQLSAASRFTFSSVFIGAAITTIALLLSRKSIEGGIWIALSVIAIGSHYFWWAYMMATGVKVIYYPFDLIVAIICLAGLWFKNYYEMHQETKAQAVKLQAADIEKDEFLANTSHELRNPLHSILNISQGVLDREGDSLQPESVRNLETVLSVSQRMSFTLNELLEMTRLEGNKPQLYIKPISMQAIVEGVIDMLQYKVKTKPLVLVNKIPKDFPIVMGDENRVTQIVFNLLHNAVKYTHRGEVVIQAFEKNDLAHISIKDTGIGMDKATIRNIFDPYEQGVNGETMMEGGFGLGLNISEKLVKWHGGTLRVDSVLNEGSQFTFTLPVSNDQAKYETASTSSLTMVPVPKSDDIQTSKGTLQSLDHKKTNKQSENYIKIIVVDDDPVNLEVMETILSSRRYNIRTVLSGKEALLLLEKEKWDLVITDVMMPEMSGYELTRQIRERFSVSELPILLLTARNQVEDIENGFLAGANDYVTKPIEARELRARVNVLTEVQRLSYERILMESAWLQAQIQPHFLFNTLNSIMALSEIDLERMRRLIDEFSQVLRAKFNFHQLNDFVSMEEELSLVKSYVYIQQERYEERLKVHWDMEEDLQIMIPSLTIQPLVENAIEHGVMPLLEGGNITIRIRDLDSHIEVIIEDDGVGIEEEVLEQIKSGELSQDFGIGIKNTNERLKRLFGKGLEINSTPGVGTKVKFIIPLNIE